PYFYIDVPVDRSPDSVAYVADQLKDYGSFLEDVTGKRLDEERLKKTLASTERTLKNLERAQQLKKDRYLNNSLRGELFEIFGSHIMLGTSDMETYSNLLCRDLEKADRAKGVRILWMHVVPYYIEPLVKLMSFNPRCQIITCEMNYDVCTDIDPEKPYESMAKRLVYHPFNGSYTYRAESSIKMCKELDIDGVIYFCQWGCKHTAGIAACMKESFEAAGYPMLILGGDACDRNNGGEGQLMTRIEAFVEMLEDSKLT
ncbi:MAG: 2-hydroxyacyl-CoA dehydratase, partial [Firmicutes bacterium]|nr:2-hydroxyacyl-CoA dehydratase [Bacillota bacterium]